jgi:hypothetical protein
MQRFDDNFPPSDKEAQVAAALSDLRKQGKISKEEEAAFKKVLVKADNVSCKQLIDTLAKRPSNSSAPEQLSDEEEEGQVAAFAERNAREIARVMPPAQFIKMFSERRKQDPKLTARAYLGQR